MDHSYEEIRAATLDILAGRETCTYEPHQYNSIERGAAEVFLRREIGEQEAMNQMRRGDMPHLSRDDADLFMEVFWDLFRQGIITLGYNASNREFPFCRVSRMGKRIIENQDVYFFHDVSTYERLIVEEIPLIDPVTLLYLKEAMQAFRAGCILSATVMLGVATEHTFLLLLEVLERSPTHSQTFRNVFTERTILQKINKFKNVLDQQLASLPSEIREDLDTNFAGILSVIRTFRNQSGHPTGKIIDREQAYILLQLFIPYCKKMYALMDTFT
jgi:hypothetical protein